MCDPAIDSVWPFLIVLSPAIAIIAYIAISGMIGMFNTIYQTGKARYLGICWYCQNSSPSDDCPYCGQ